MNFTVTLFDEEEMMIFGARLSRFVPSKAYIYLVGDLGAGKTTLTRGFLRGLGYEGRVKSPTYTLIEPYDIAGKIVYHFDLYRIAHSEELMMIGMSDYLNEEAICMIEWPERGEGFLPEPDLALTFNIQEQGRYLSVQAKTPLGRNILGHLIHA